MDCERFFLFSVCVFQVILYIGFGEEKLLSSISLSGRDGFLRAKSRTLKYSSVGKRTEWDQLFRLVVSEPYPAIGFESGATSLD